MTDRIRPFYCGSQMADWQASNCDSCDNRTEPDDTGGFPARLKCDIDQALLEAYCGDGLIPLAVAERAGFKAGDRRYVFPCLEHRPPFVNVRADGTVDPSIKAEHPGGPA